MNAPANLSAANPLRLRDLTRSEAKAIGEATFDAERLSHRRDDFARAFAAIAVRSANA